MPGRGETLLAAGAALGIALAASGLLSSVPGNPGALPSGAIARVNGELILEDDYRRALAGLGADRRGEIGPEERRRVLDRLIEAELLVQRGLELGLARHDARVRADLTAAVISSVVAEHEDDEPAGAEVEAFYAANRDFFTRPGRLRLRQVFLRMATDGDAPAAIERASRAAERLRAGEPFPVVRDAFGDRELAPVPDELLPPEKLLDYLGPTVLRAALALEAGAVSEPVRSRAGLHVLQVAERQADRVPPLGEIRAEVVAELRRRAGERALRESLDELRRRAAIEMAPGVP